MGDWDSIPEELRWTPQWCLAGPDDHGKLKVPHTIKGTRAKTTRSATWSDFESVCEAALARGWGIGFILSASDPYTVIDLDVKDASDYPEDSSKWTTDEQKARFASIVEKVDSYTEISSSGKGAHIWVRANIGLGRKRDSVELYSQERFIVCTGNVYRDIPIVDRQEFVTAMASQMSVENHEFESDWVDSNQVLGDGELCDALASQENGNKFLKLYRGEIDEFGYPSQSEADFALMSMFAFLSNNDAQCLRLFRMSALGQREKATKNDSYLTKRCLWPIRQRQMAEAARDEHFAMSAAALMQGADGILNAVNSNSVNMIHVPSIPESYVPPEEVANTTLPWPPGRAGQLAWSFYNNAPRPIAEVAIISVLGLLSGLCGRNFQFERTGLNGYYVLVGKSAIGKEAMHANLSQVVQELLSGSPEIDDYIDFNSYSSGQALTKAVSEKNCFVNVAGEFGHKLKRFGQEGGHDAAMQSLRKTITDLYQKSSRGTIVGGLGYSDKEKNVASVKGVAYSMIGETTPSTYYESLTTAMMSDGFLSRFITIYCNSERPPLNKVPHTPLSKDLFDTIAYLVWVAKGEAFVDVQASPEAMAMLDTFDRECDATIMTDPDNESWRQLWNRAHLKVSRIAALLGVFDHPIAPMIMPYHCEWAIMLIRNDIAAMANSIKNGDVGLGDHQRRDKLISCCRDYKNYKKVPAGYHVPPALHAAGIISKRYFQLRTQKAAAFEHARAGSDRALDDAIRSMLESGFLKEVPQKKLDELQFQGKCYYVLKLQD